MLTLAVPHPITARFHINRLEKRDMFGVWQTRHGIQSLHVLGNTGDSRP